LDIFYTDMFQVKRLQKIPAFDNIDKRSMFTIQYDLCGQRTRVSLDSIFFLNPLYSSDNSRTSYTKKRQGVLYVAGIIVQVTIFCTGI